MANQLAGETSPYLLQHANNPVNWLPWGAEALAKAAAEDKPIFLSIGYSACHWCHVMAHESFEDERVAAILNEHYVSIKVDREERPDLDRIYMAAVQALSGQGGWPMSVFLSSDGAPFYGGTYYPPTSRYGLPAFTQVLSAVSDAWRHRRDQLRDAGEEILRAIRANIATRQSSSEHTVLEPQTLLKAEEALTTGYDTRYGGWGQGPKFPQPMALEFLLRRHHTTRNPATLRLVTHALDAMARGGIYDQLGGGFHRYAVDAEWLTPHFEKMLYDNAQLARVYLHAWQVTSEPCYRAIAEETLDYVVLEMTDASGGFHSAQDADSEGLEGAFFTWTMAEVREILGAEADPFVRAYPVTATGNFEGRNILTFTGSFEERVALQEQRTRLWRAREARVHPGRDDKVLVSWNGLMLAAFAEAARLLDRRDYRRVAERNAAFLLREMRAADGRLYHTWRAGHARLNGYLEDYTHLIEGLIELYEATFETRWLTAARNLTDIMIAHYSAPDGFYDTSDDHEALIVRPSEIQDNATPSGNAMASRVLLRLAHLLQEPSYTALAERNLARVTALAGDYPQAFGQWLVAIDHALSPNREVAIIGDPVAADTQALIAVCRQSVDPHLLLAVGLPDAGAQVALLRGRPQRDGRATAYVCSGATCMAPVTEPESLAEILHAAP